MQRAQSATPAPPCALALRGHLRPRATFPDGSAKLLIELLRAGRSVRFRARGGSMWPSIPAGSLLEITPGAGRTLRAGALVAFERDGRVIVHRVVRATPGAIEVRGDALDRSDASVPCAHLLGRARVVERRRLRPRLPNANDARIACRALWRRVEAQLLRYAG